LRKPANPESEICLEGLEGFIDGFLEDRIVELEQLKEALTSGNTNYKIIAELAHKWKGIAAPYGFGILGEIAAELEAAALEKKQGETLQLITEATEYLHIDKKKATHF
jgi:HPt (histidine-containing phosphotransfer) domain-containing protein